MYFKQILNEDCGCSSYVVASRASRECAIVDAGLEIQPYLDVMQDRGLTLRYIVDTHLHADHVSGSRRLSGETGVPVSLHQSADVLFPFEPLHDGQKLGLGPVVLEVMHTPGHRPESVSLLITNPPRSPLPSMVLTGDCLFVGDVGRPDFGGPDAAGQQYESSRRLLGLEDYVEVFPAHFEGSCGRGMCGRPSSTIGFERRFNPMLQLPTKDEFVRELISSRPPKPLNMDAIIATNRGAAPMGWAMLRHPLPHVQDVTIEQARPKMDSGAWWVSTCARTRSGSASTSRGRTTSRSHSWPRGCRRFPARACPWWSATAACARTAPPSSSSRRPSPWPTAWPAAPPGGRRRVCRSSAAIPPRPASG